MGKELQDASGWREDPDAKLFQPCRPINLIVIHCSATRENRDYTEHDLDVCHRQRGFDGPGYHFYVRKDGRIVRTRPIEKIGAHVKGYNKSSVGICYEGGLDAQGRTKDTRTQKQKEAIRALQNDLLERFPGCKICGHRDLSPDRNGNGKIEPEEWIKECPCYDVN